MKLLLVQCAALGYEFWRTHKKASFWDRLDSCAVETVFPAVTCSVQASLRTAVPPSSHGMICNGFFDRRLHRAFFWEQSAALFDGERIWDDFRRCGGTVGQICWQQALGSDCDLLLSPAPIHKHHGGMIQDFYARPDDLYHRLCSKLGKRFNLMHYWGPFTSQKSTRWISLATAELLRSGQAPDLLLTYLPHLDYELQKSGPESPGAARAMERLEALLEPLVTVAIDAGYELIVLGDYAINPAKKVVFPNCELRKSGLFGIREIRGMLYPDLHAGRAFTLADHQIAHVFVPDAADIPAVRRCLEELDGVAACLPRSEILDHPNSGELVLQAEPGAWFAYPWWESPEQAPDFASHVDIHNKPGFDPCELFLSLWPPMSVGRDPGKIGGTHGLKNGLENKVLWAVSDESLLADSSLLDGAAKLRQQLC